MESLKENKPLLWSIIGSILAIMALISGLLPDIANQFAIVEFPTDVSHLQMIFLNLIFGIYF